MQTPSRPARSPQPSKEKPTPPKKSRTDSKGRRRPGSRSRTPAGKISSLGKPAASSLTNSVPLLDESELASLTAAQQQQYLALLQKLDLVIEQERLRDLPSFIQAAWRVLEPATPFIWNWHLDLMAEYLMLARGRKVKRLIFNVPPQTTKSRFVTVMYPAWTWATSAPGRRFMTVSYSGGATGLSTIHSTERRTVLESGWFQEHFPDKVRFTGNQKTQYENTAGGRMVATSTGGTATGKGVHDIICLPGEVRIRTDRGDLPISTIVEQHLNCRVLGPSGWNRISGWQCNAGRELLEIVTEDGGVLPCTEDHPVFVEGRGYMAAKDMISLQHGNLQVRGLSKRVRQAPSTRIPISAGSLLFAAVFRALRAREKQSWLDRRCREGALPELQAAVSGLARRCPQAAVLFKNLHLGLLQKAAANYLSGLWRAASSSWPSPAVLFPALRLDLAPDGGIASDEWPMEVRPVCWNYVWPGGLEGIEALGSDSRWTAVRGLQNGSEAFACAPHRRQQDSECPGQSGEPLHPVPPESTHQDRNQYGLDEPVRVATIRGLPAPDWVYNIMTEPDHAYYANGILTHNCDDLMNPREAESELERLAALGFFDKTLRSRLSDQKTGVIIIVEQRLHEDDLTGHVLEQEKEATKALEALVTTQPDLRLEDLETEHWTLVRLPMRAEEDERWVFPISGRVVERRKGELLWPERFPESVVQNLQITLGSRAYSAQYQQRPSPAGGIIFNPNWWRYYRLGMTLDLQTGQARYAGELPGLEIVVLSVDCAFKEAVDNDFVSLEVWGFVGPRCYVIDKQTDHLSYVATKAAIRAMRKKHPLIRVILIEDKANGSAVISELQKEDLGADVVPIEPEGGKVARAWACSSTIEVGSCYLPEDADWVGAFVELWAKFPAVKHDDDVDSGTQALNWRKAQWMRLGVLEYYQREQVRLAPEIAAGRLPDPRARRAAAPQGPAAPEDPVPGQCPRCGSAAIRRQGTGQHCNQCSHEWGARKVETYNANRKGINR